MTAQRKYPPLPPNGLELADQRRARRAITVPDGTPFSAVLETSYWQHVSRYLTLGDIIEVSDEQDEWHAEVKVTDKGDYEKNDNWAKVKLLWKTDLVDKLKENDVHTPNGYEVRWSGRIVRWAVVRSADQKRLWSSEPGKTEKQDAIDWAWDHAKRADDLSLKQPVAA